MRLASFNILHGQPVRGVKPVDGVADPAQLLEAIGALAPTVIGLQEVDLNQDRSGLVDQTRAVAETLGASHWRFVPTVVGTPGGRLGFRPSTGVERQLAEGYDHRHRDPQYGVALISKLPVTTWRVRVFPAAPLWMPLLVQSDSRPRMIRVRDEPRAAIAACIETAMGPITVVTAHLSFVPGFNIRQLRQIREWVSDLPRPLFFLGDFNLPGGLPTRSTGMTPLLREWTFPSYKPRVQFDHILVDGFDEKQTERLAAASRTWQLAVSDHCAISVDVPETTGGKSSTF